LAVIFADSGVMTKSIFSVDAGSREGLPSTRPPYARCHAPVNASTVSQRL